VWCSDCGVLLKGGDGSVGGDVEGVVWKAVRRWWRWWWWWWWWWAYLFVIYSSYIYVVTHTHLHTHTLPHHILTLLLHTHSSLTHTTPLHPTHTLLEPHAHHVPYTHAHAHARCTARLTFCYSRRQFCCRTGSFSQFGLFGLPLYTAFWCYYWLLPAPHTHSTHTLRARTTAHAHTPHCYRLHAHAPAFCGWLDTTRTWLFSYLPHARFTAFAIHTLPHFARVGLTLPVYAHALHIHWPLHTRSEHTRLDLQLPTLHTRDLRCCYDLRLPHTQFIVTTFTRLLRSLLHYHHFTHIYSHTYRSLWFFTQPHIHTHVHITCHIHTVIHLPFAYIYTHTVATRLHTHTHVIVAHTFIHTHLAFVLHTHTHVYHTNRESPFHVTQWCGGLWLWFTLCLLLIRVVHTIYLTFTILILVWWLLTHWWWWPYPHSGIYLICLFVVWLCWQYFDSFDSHWCCLVCDIQVLIRLITFLLLIVDIC